MSGKECKNYVNCGEFVENGNLCEACESEASEFDRFVMPLDVKTIDQLFKNVERLEDERCESYRVRGQFGHDAGVINYLGKNEWRVFVDNFPSQKKYFAWNLPIKTVGEFVVDIQRTGLELVPA